MAKFDSPAVVTRKLQSELDQKNTRGGLHHKKPFNAFVKRVPSKIVRVREDRQKLLKKKSMRLMMFVQRNRVHVFELLQLRVLSHEQPSIELCLNISHCSLTRCISFINSTNKTFRIEPRCVVHCCQCYRISRFKKTLSFQKEASFYMNGFVNKHNIRYWWRN